MYWTKFGSKKNRAFGAILMIFALLYSVEYLKFFACGGPFSLVNLALRSLQTVLYSAAGDFFLHYTACTRQIPQVLGLKSTQLPPEPKYFGQNPTQLPPEPKYLGENPPNYLPNPSTWVKIQPNCLPNPSTWVKIHPTTFLEISS